MVASVGLVVMVSWLFDAFLNEFDFNLIQNGVKISREVISTQFANCVKRTASLELGEVLTNGVWRPMCRLLSAKQWIIHQMVRRKCDVNVM